jgi:hypothetical protein
MKTSNPYGANYSVKVPPETINSEQSQASKKAKARYPNKPLGPSVAISDSGQMKRRAYTPGGPSGS